MTWSTLLETGAGKVEFRLRIAGLEADFVTHLDMEAAASEATPSRVAGLERDGLSISEQVDPAHAELELGDMTVRILDEPGNLTVTKALSQAPTRTTFLTTNLSTSGTFCDVANASGVTTGTILHIGTECIRVSTVASNTLSGLQRARRSTIAQAHYASIAGLQTGAVVYVDRAPNLEGRRAYLYAYGEGDDLQDDGTLIWRGICLTDAHLDDTGSAWEITIAGLTELHRQDLGAGLEVPFEPRGVYYSRQAPLIIRLNAGYDDNQYVVIVGHYESNQDLADEINTQMATPLAGGDYTDYEVEAFGTAESWGFDVRYDSATPKTNRCRIRAFSALGDRVGYRGESKSDGSVLDFEEFSTAAQYGDIPTGVAFRFGEGLAAPRGSFGRSDDPAVKRAGLSDSRDLTIAIVDATALGDAPENALYLDGPVDLTANLDAFEIEWDDDQEPSSQSVLVAETSTARAVVVNRYFNRLRVFTANNLPSLRLKRGYARGGLHQFRVGLVAAAPDNCNLGTMPLVTDEDWGSWIEATKIEAGAQIAGSRLFVAFESVKLGDMLKEEFKLRGLYPHLDGNGRIVLSPLKLPSATDPVVATIDESYQVAPARATWERNALGSINTVVLRTGYDAIEDDHKGRKYITIDREAYARLKAPRQLDIAPVSEYLEGLRGLSEFTSEDFTALMQPVLGIFGRPYAVVTVDVDMRLFHVLVGSVVDVEASHLPDIAAGTRDGSYRGIVIGRSWELVEGRGQLRILAFLRPVHGWAPSAHVSAQSNTSGDTWLLTLSQQDPGGTVTLWQADDVISDHFASGDKVRVMRWNDSADTPVTGTVDAVTSTTATVTFDTTWTPGADDWILEFQGAGDVVSGQRPYMYLGDTDGSVSFSSGDQTREWAP